MSPILSIAMLASWTLGAVPDVTQIGPASGPQRARALYADGLRHYSLAEYDEAIASFKEAFRLTGAPELLFDIAQALRKKGPGSCRDALEVYDSYLRAEPDASRRGRALPLRAEVEACARRAAPAAEPGPARAGGPQGPTAAPPAAAPPPVAEAQHLPERRPTALGPALLASGALVGLGGATLAWSVRWSDSCKPFCSPSQVHALEARAYSGYALVAAGGAAAAVGLGLWLWYRPSPPPVTLAPMDRGLSIAGTF